MPPQPEQKKPVWQKAWEAIVPRLEWLQQHPLKGSIIAAGAGLASLFLAPLALELTQKSDAYTAFAETKPVDRLLGFLGWLVAGTISIPVLVIWVFGLAVWIWFNRQKARPSGEKSPQMINPEIEDLKRQLEQERKKRPETPAKEANAKEFSNVLANQPDHRSVVSFLFKFKDGTFIDVSREVSISQAAAQKILKELELDNHLIDRIGQTPQGHVIYALNVNGARYATAQGMTPGNQNMGDVRASEAEKELFTLRQEFQKVCHEAAELRMEKVESARGLERLNRQLDEALKPRSAAAPLSGGCATIQ